MSTGRCFNLADLFEVTAEAAPDRTALVAGDVRLTYAELEARANRVARHLLGVGLPRGAHVGVLAWNRAEWVEVMLGAFKARLVPVNVNYRYVEDELRYVFTNADLAALVVERSLLPRATAALAAVPSVRHVVVLEDGGDAALPEGAVGYEEALAAASPAGGLGPRSPDDRYVLYTGGTTGMPKGVVWRQEDLFFAALGGGNFGGAPIDRPEDLAAKAAGDPVVQVVTAPMMHGGGQWMTLISFTMAGTAVLWSERHFDADRVLALAARERALTLMLVGDAMAAPVADALEAATERYDLSSLFAVGSGGAGISPAVKERLRRLLPGRAILDNFGASETGRAGSVQDDGRSPAGPRFTVGPDVTVLDDDLREAPPGVVGWFARTGHIPLGYHNDPDRTAATFRVDGDGRRWVLPGDFARREHDGTITLLGRGAVCINSGGEKVFPEEVEAVLRAHPDVRDVVVVGEPDPRFGERVAALVVPRAGAAPTLDDLAGHCRRHLAGYKAPRRLHLVPEVARTAAGKTDYRWAREYVVSMGEQQP